MNKMSLWDGLLVCPTHQASQEHEQAWANYAESVCDQIDAGMLLHNLDTIIAELNQSIIKQCVPRWAISTELLQLDVSLFDQIGSEDLLSHIQRVGKVFYQKESVLSP
jgi:hypothetical protein